MKKPSEKSIAIAKFYLENQKMKHADIGSRFGVSAGRVSQIINNERMADYFPVLLRKRIKAFAPAALQAIEDCVTQDKNLQVKEKAATTILKETKVFDAPEIRVEHTLELKPIEELRAIVGKAQVGPDNVVEGEVVNETEEGLQ